MRIRIHIIDFLTLYCIHMQDQMIIFMALATGESVLRCGPLTLHTESAIHVAEQLTGAKFTIRQAQSCHSAQPVLWSRSRIKTQRLRVQVQVVQEAVAVWLRSYVVAELRQFL